MKKNFYEILEIDLNASPEIVEKAYKTLVKKYHPDLQNGDKKAKYEEKLKVINKAYETLSDPEKRKAYDETLPGHVSAEEYENLRRQKEYMKDRITRMEQQNNGYSGNVETDSSFIDVLVSSPFFVSVTSVGTLSYSNFKSSSSTSSSIVVSFNVALSAFSPYLKYNPFWLSFVSI